MATTRTFRTGFTLVEALLAITLTVMAGTALLLALESSLHSSQESLERDIAVGIAQQLLDEAAGLRYSAAGAGPHQWPLAKASGEGPERASMDDVDDWANYAAAPPEDRFGIELGQEDGEGGLRHSALRLRDGYFENWRVEIDVYYVDDGDPSVPLSPGSTSDHRAVNVRVIINDPDGRRRQIVRMRRVFAYVP